MLVLTLHSLESGSIARAPFLNSGRLLGVWFRQETW